MPLRKRQRSPSDDDNGNGRELKSPDRCDLSSWRQVLRRSETRSDQLGDFSKWAELDSSESAAISALRDLCLEYSSADICRDVAKVVAQGVFIQHGGHISSKARQRFLESDAVVTFWLRKRKISNDKELANLVREYFPAEVPRVSSIGETDASKAFCLPELSREDQMQASAVLSKKIISYAERYSKSSPYTWVSPYTSLVGPSGIGKSFAVKNIAASNLQYVFYASLSPGDKKAAAYPPLSAFAALVNKHAEGGSDEKGKPYRKAKRQAFWMYTIAAALIDISACRLAGIPPRDYYSIQVLPQSAERYGKSFCGFVSELEEKHVKFNFSELSDAYLERRVKELEDCREYLEKPSSAETCASPISIICLDEARTLRDKEESSMFLSFRNACAEVFTNTSPFFGLLVETLLRIKEFSPAPFFDPSRKSLPAVENTLAKLFAPLYHLDTWDLFRKPYVFPDGTEEFKAFHFTLGRPLWGAMYQINPSSYKLYQIACLRIGINKTEGPTLSLALLSYCLCFDIRSQLVADELVEKHLHYLIAISEDRSSSLVCQPSEPLLAYAAVNELRHPEKLSTALSTFYNHCSQGLVHIGDTGEFVAMVIILVSCHDACELKAQTVGDFFRRLVCQEMFQELSANVPFSSSQNTWSNGFVFVTHFTRLENLSISEDVLKRAFHRGAALLCGVNTPYVDLVVPVFFRDSGRCTALLFRVSNRRCNSMASSLLVQAENVAAAAKDFHLADDCIAILMSLRGKPDSADGRSWQVKDQRPSGRSRRRSSVFSDKPLVGLILGISEGVYPNACSSSDKSSRKQIYDVLQRLAGYPIVEGAADEYGKRYLKALLEW